MKIVCCQIHHSKGWILFVSRVDVVPSAQIIDLCLKIDSALKIDNTWSDTREILNHWQENKTYSCKKENLIREGDKKICFLNKNSFFSQNSICLFRTLYSHPALTISFDDISLCNYRIIFKISLKYRYRIFFENITRH